MPALISEMNDAIKYRRLFLSVDDLGQLEPVKSLLELVVL